MYCVQINIKLLLLVADSRNGKSQKDNTLLVNTELYLHCVVYTNRVGIIIVTRYTVHGRGAKLERTISRIDQLVPPSQHWNLGPVEMMGQSGLRWAHVTHRQFKTVWFWHPFLPVKSHDHFLMFPQKCHFFSSKKGSPNRPIPLAIFINCDPVFWSLKIKGSNYQ